MMSGTGGGGGTRMRVAAPATQTVQSSAFGAPSNHVLFGASSNQFSARPFAAPVHQASQASFGAPSNYGSASSFRASVSQQSVTTATSGGGNLFGNQGSAYIVSDTAPQSRASGVRSARPTKRSLAVMPPEPTYVNRLLPSNDYPRMEILTPWGQSSAYMASDSASEGFGSDVRSAGHANFGSEAAMPPAPRYVHRLLPSNPTIIREWEY